jgi:DNA-directed RNA polymerase specialized sigma subunit
MPADRVQATGAMVMRAIYDLEKRLGRWPTAQEIAEYLKVAREEVRPILGDLHNARLFKERQRNGRKVWLPWSAP